MMHSNELLIWRKRMGWTQKLAAEYLQVNLRTYENWEQGHRKVGNEGPVRKLMKQAKLDKPTMARSG